MISCVRGDIRIEKPVTAGRGETLSSAARRMRDNHVGTLIIVEGQKPMASSLTATWLRPWAQTAFPRKPQSRA